MATNFLKNKEDIIAWLNAHKIEDYQLIAYPKYNWVINVSGDVLLDNLGLKEIPVKFNIIKGVFICSRNELTNLDAAPIKCNSFNCNSNKITSLKGCPQEIKNHFFCEDNKLVNLEGGPKSVGMHYFCYDNELTSLKGAPRVLKNGNFVCSDNPHLKSLKHCPQLIGCELHAQRCSLESLEYLPKKINLNCIKLDGNELLGGKQHINNFKKLKSLLVLEKKSRMERENLNAQVKLAIDKNNNLKTIKI